MSLSLFLASRFLRRALRARRRRFARFVRRAPLACAPPPPAHPVDHHPLQPRYPTPFHALSDDPSTLSSSSSHEHVAAPPPRCARHATLTVASSCVVPSLTRVRLGVRARHRASVSLYPRCRGTVRCRPSCSLFHAAAPLMHSLHAERARREAKRKTRMPRFGPPTSVACPTGSPRATPGQASGVCVCVCLWQCTALFRLLRPPQPRSFVSPLARRWSCLASAPAPLHAFLLSARLCARE